MKLYHKNPRQITEKQFTDLGGSLSRLGDLGGIVHDLNSDEIIGGNQRSRVFDINQCEIELKEQYIEPDEQGTVGLGFVIWRGKKYAYRQVRWTVKQCEEANIRANKNGGSFDFDTLANEFELDDLLEWGFERKELDLDLWTGEQPDDPGAQMDKAEELREKWGVESGQLWKLGEHRLICGDCTDRTVVERVMMGEKAVLTVTSPPYAVGKEYETGVSFEDHLKLLREFTDRTLEITIPGGFIFTNFGEIAALSHASPLTGSDRQCIYLISKDYWQIYHEERRCDLYAQRIWYKPFNRLQQPFWSYKTSIPHYQEWEHIWTWRVPGGNGDRPTDWDISVHAIWDTRNEATEDHPLTRHVAAFPVGIPERAIKAHSLKGEIIYEPFSGSGTTLIACGRLNRKCRAIEISPTYCAVAIQRWVDMTGGIPELLDVQT